MSSTSRSAFSSGCGSSRRDSAAAAAKDKVSATASGKDGFSIKSADGKFAVRLKGLVQTDGRFFLCDSAVPVTNTFFLRRARPILEATVGQVPRVPAAAGLRPGHDGAVRRLHRREGLAGVRRPGRQVQAAGGPRAAAVGQRHRLRRARAGRPTSPPTATSASSSRATSRRGARSPGRPASSTACPTSATATATSATPRTSPAASSSSRSRPARSRASASASPAPPASSAAPRRRPQLAGYRTAGQQTWFRYVIEHHDAREQRVRRRPPPAARAAGLLLHRPARPPRRVHPVVAGGEPGGLRHRQAQAHGLAGHRLVLPHRREELLAERRAQEAVRSQGRHASARSSSPRATASSASTTRRSRRSPTRPARRARPRRGRWASTGTSPSRSRSWSTTSTRRSPAAPPPAIASRRTSSPPASSTPSDDLQERPSDHAHPTRFLIGPCAPW